MNKVFLIGRLTKDPELEHTKSGVPSCIFTIAVDGMSDKTDFIMVKVFDKQAENLCKYMEKGRQLAVIGRISTGKYEKDGKTVFTKDIIADNIEYLGSAPSKENTVDATQMVFEAFAKAEEDIPF